MSKQVKVWIAVTVDIGDFRGTQATAHLSRRDAESSIDERCGEYVNERLIPAGINFDEDCRGFFRDWFWQIDESSI